MSKARMMRCPGNGPSCKPCSGLKPHKETVRCCPSDKPCEMECIPVTKRKVPVVKPLDY